MLQKNLHRFPLFLILLMSLVIIFGFVICISCEESDAETVAEGSCGDAVTWSLDEGGTLTISGTGDMSSWQVYSSRPWQSHRDLIRHVVVGNGVTGIGGYAFYYHQNLQSVTLSNTVTTIGNGAFSNCSSLSTMTIPDSVVSLGLEVFQGSGLRSVVIGSGISEIPYRAFTGSMLIDVTMGVNVTTIRSMAFYQCGQLLSVTITPKVLTIGDYAFTQCNKLTEICNDSSLVFTMGSDSYGCIAKNATNIYSSSSGSSVFQSFIDAGGNKFLFKPIGNGFELIYSDQNSGAVTLPVNPVIAGNTVSSYIVGDYAFSRSGITSLTVGNSVTSIGNYAFYMCRSLATVDFGSTVSSIGDYAFSNSALTSVSIPDSVAYIGERALSQCDALETVHIGTGLGQFSGSTFSNCGSLTSIEIDSDQFVTVDGVIYSKDMKELVYCPSGKTGNPFVVPDTVERISSNAFQSNSGITSISIPDTVTYFGDQAFAETSITFTDPIYYSGDVTYVGNQLYWGHNDIPGFEFDIDFHAEVSVGGFVTLSFQNAEGQLYPVTTDNLRGKGFELTHPLNQYNVPIDVYRQTKTGLSIKYQYPDGTQAFDRITGFFDLGHDYSYDTPALYGYTADRTSVSGTIGSDFVDIVVTYNPDPHNLIYKIDGETVLIEVKTYSSSVTLADYHKKGYSLTKWTTEDVVVTDGTFTMPNKDVTVSCESSPRAFDVVFRLDGTEYDRRSVVFGSQITIPDTEPTRQEELFVRYQFKGWGGYTPGMLLTEEGMVFDAIMVDFAKTVEDGQGNIRMSMPGDSMTLDADITEGIRWYAGEYPSSTLIATLGQINAVFDNAAMLAMPTGESVMSLRSVDITEQLRESLGERPIYDFSLTGATDFGRGAVTIVIPYVLKNGENADYLKVVAIVDGVATDRTECSYSEGKVTMVAYRPFMFAIGYVDPNVVDAESITSSDNNLFIEMPDTFAVFSEKSLNTIKETAESNPETVMTVSVGQYKAMFDNAAIRSLSNECSELVITEAVITDEVRGLVGERPVFEISFDSNTDFGGGFVTFSIPYVLKEGEDPSNLIIYYLNNGEISEEIECEYKDGCVIFSTNHLSTYALGYEEPNENSNNMLFVVAGVIVFTLLAGLVFVVVRKHRNQS